MTVSHLDNLTINIFLENAPAPVRGFSNVLLLVDEADSNPLDGSSRFLTFTKPSDATAAFDASQINSTVRDTVLVMFGQDVVPPAILVGRVDTGGAETYPDGLDACLAEGGDFYGIVTDLRETADAAIQIALSTHVETAFDRSALLCLQVGSGTTDWVAAGTTYPAGPPDWDPIDGYERTILIYHDDEGEFADAAYMANRLAADPDVVSAPWDAGIQLVGGFTTALTSTTKANLYNESNGGRRVNIGLPYGDEDFFVDPGKNIASGLGRPIYEMVTRDWFEARLQERIALLKTRESARFRKITIDTVGQGKVLSVIDALLNQAQEGDSPHLIASRATAETITQADIDAQRLRFTVQGQFASSARLFEFDVYFTRTPLVL